MARRTLPPLGPVVPVKGRPGIIPGKAPVVTTKRKKLVPVPDADEPTAAVVVRPRRSAPAMPPPAGRKQAPAPPGPAARRTAMQALKAGKVAF
jgi:hypothetical protein